MDESGAGASYESALADVRERIVQVKRETDAKAPADHDHGELSANLDRLESEVESLREESEAVRELADAADERIESGFENYAASLERLLERTETIEERLDTLGATALAAREHVEDRERLGGLARAANRAGVRTASCGECDETIDVGLLSAPECPHCEAAFAEFAPGRGLFGSATLRGEQ
ncbi:MAG: hypothetical protein QXG03_03375 [Halalkalicoccus sp.]